LIGELESKTLEMTKTSNSVKDIEAVNKALEERLLISEKEKEGMQRKYSDEVKTLEGNLLILKNKCEELKEAKMSSDDAIVSYVCYVLSVRTFKVSFLTFHHKYYGHPMVFLYHTFLFSLAVNFYKRSVNQ